MLLFSINIDNLTLESFKCLTVVKLIEILKSHDEPIAGSMDVLVTEQDSGNKFIAEKWKCYISLWLLHENEKRVLVSAVYVLKTLFQKERGCYGI